MRHPYRMRPVVRTFMAAPVSWGKEPVLRALMSDEYRMMRWPRWVEMACGHIRRDTEQVYGNETAVRVRAAFRVMAEATGEAVPRKCRCYECAKQERS